MAITSQNGWPVLRSDDPRLKTWSVPAKNGVFRITLRNGSAGFLIVHFLLWLTEVVEDLTDGVADEGGYAYRVIRGSVGWSNHASATAADMNWTRHPLGKRGTWKPWQYVKIRARLLFYRGCLRWGGDYRYRADEMHVEINKPLAVCEKNARRLASTPRGRRILEANPGQLAVIRS